MQLTRILRQGFIELDLELPRATEENEETGESAPPKTREELVIELLRLLVDRLPEKVVGNRSQLFTDLWNREKKASTALGHGIAMPHVRTMQAKQAVMGFARLAEPLDIGAPDGELVRLVFLLVGPPYDDRVYLRIYKALGPLLDQEEVRRRLLEATSEGEVLRVLG
ncbi:MAG: PTS sugar transporter subunit IIA [Planctomycetota bacterium]